ncbi:MAG: hypothetical protein J0I11_13290 [Actinobacteria bacterium]|nr:hypothetical protein [Actinomycetota bacterium]
MTEPPIEPEMWISDGSEGPDGGPPPRGAPRGPGRGWGRWIAIVAGFAVLLALVSVQHFLGGTGGHGAEPTTGVSVTPPPTSRSETPRTDMTESSTVATSGHFDDHGPDSGGVTTGALHDSPAVVTAGPTATVTPQTAPITTTAPNSSLPVGQNWELVGFEALVAQGDSGSAVVRYRPGTGEVVTTPVPSLNSNGPLSFAVTPHAAIIRPMDYVPGYVVPDGRPAQFAQAHLAVGGSVFAGPNPGDVWVFAPDGNRLSFQLVDASGKAVGASMTVPESLGITGGWMFTANGAGYILASAIGGTYDLGPGGARLVTHGKVLAAGPKNYLVYECNDTAQCGTAVLDRATGHRTRLAAFAPSESILTSPIQGVVSPDGRYAALLDYGYDGPSFDLVDLRTGILTPIKESPSSGSASAFGDAESILVFTPDDHFLLIAAAGGVFPIDVTTGVKLSPLPIPPLAAIAIRPAD